MKAVERPTIVSVPLLLAGREWLNDGWLSWGQKRREQEKRALLAELAQPERVH